MHFLVQKARTHLFHFKSLTFPLLSSTTSSYSATSSPPSASVPTYTGFHPISVEEIYLLFMVPLYLSPKFFSLKILGESVLAITILLYHLFPPFCGLVSSYMLLPISRSKLLLTPWPLQQPLKFLSPSQLFKVICAVFIPVFTFSS